MIRLISLLALCAAAVSAKNTNTLLRQQTQGQAQAAVSEQSMVDPITGAIIVYAAKKAKDAIAAQLFVRIFILFVQLLFNFLILFLFPQLDAKTKAFALGIEKALDMVNGECKDVLDASSALFLLMTSYRSCSPRSKKVGIALRTAISSLATKVIKLKTPKDCAQLTDAASVAAVTPITDLPQTILCNGLKSADLAAVVAASGPEDYKKMMTGAFLF